MIKNVKEIEVNDMMKIKGRIFKVLGYAQMNDLVEVVLENVANGEEIEEMFNERSEVIIMDCNEVKIKKDMKLIVEEIKNEFEVPEDKISVSGIEQCEYDYKVYFEIKYNKHESVSYSCMPYILMNEVTLYQIHKIG